MIKILYTSIVLAALLPQFAFAQKGAQKEFISPAIMPLVEQIRACDTSPVDYVLRLFDQYDVVVLGERDHMDTTQYDLIGQIIADPRFIERVGYVFTEIGSYNSTDRLNGVLKGTYAADSLFDVALVRVLFDIDYMPLWEKTNYTQLMRDIYRVNRTLPAQKKLTVVPTDLPFSWNQAEGMTAKQFKPFFRVWPEKDIITANICFNEFYRIFDGPAKRKKVLMIYNTPHSCRYYKNADYGKFFAYQIIADRFPGRTANVAINWAVCSDEGYTSLSNGGKLDAAFAACGNRPAGFDLQGTPFGECFFESCEPSPLKPTKFSDVYHGFIFYKPITEWVDAVGVPNLEKIGCRDELARRCGIWHDEQEQSGTEEYKTGKMEYYSRLRSFPVTMFFPPDTIDTQISRYYRPAETKPQAKKK